MCLFRGFSESAEFRSRVLTRVAASAKYFRLCLIVAMAQKKYWTAGH